MYVCALYFRSVTWLLDSQRFVDNARSVPFEPKRAVSSFGILLGWTCVHVQTRVHPFFFIPALPSWICVKFVKLARTIARSSTVNEI